MHACKCDGHSIQFDLLDADCIISLLVFSTGFVRTCVISVNDNIIIIPEIHMYMCTYS